MNIQGFGRKAPRILHLGSKELYISAVVSALGKIYLQNTAAVGH
jgi:hypothetical protein